MYQPKGTDRRYKAILRQGHAGAGKYTEITRILWARDAVEASRVASNLGGVKKGSVSAVISIEEVNIYG